MTLQTSFETMSEDIINNTTEYMTTLIKSKDIDFHSIKSHLDILHYFTKVTQSMTYPTDKFDTKTGERITKCVATLYGRSMHTDFLKKIYNDVSSWYYNEYQDEDMIVEPVYTKSVIEVLKELKKAAWMVSAKDVPLFLKSVINTAKVMNGEKPTTDNQKSYWLVSPVKGGGKTTLTDKIFDGFESDGYKCQKLGMPEKDWPDLRPFSSCHLAVVNDVSKAPDYDVFKALTRRETFDSRIRCIGLIPTTPRAVLWGSSNYNAPYETDRGSVSINTIGTTIEEQLETAFGQTILKSARSADLAQISVLSQIDEKYLRFFGRLGGSVRPDEEEKTKKEVQVTSHPQPQIPQIPGIEILINLIVAYNENPMPQKLLSCISLQQLRKDAVGITVSDSQLSLVSRILLSMRGTTNLVSRLGEPKRWQYDRWDLSKLKDVTLDCLADQTDEIYTAEDEIKANQAAWDEIIAYFENNKPTDPTPTNDDFEKIANEILIENGEEPITKEEYEEAYKRFEKEFNMTDEEINDICGIVDQDTMQQLEEIFGNNESKPVNKINTMVKEETSYRDKFCTLPTNNKEDLFESINPIKIKPEEKWLIEDIPEYYPRKDIFCSSMRNFIFEMDDTILEEQEAIALKNINQKITNRVVFSGNKSYHNRVTIDEEPESIEHYKFIWNKINDCYFLGLADKACSNPSRLTRKPGAIRNDEKTGYKPVEQELVLSNDNVFHIPGKWNNEWIQKKLAFEMFQQMKEVKHYRHIPKSNNILEELESMEGKTLNEESRQKAISLVENDGVLCYDEAKDAVKYIGCLGFSAEDIAQQIDFGKWNFKKDYIEKLLSNLD